MIILHLVLVLIEHTNENVQEINVSTKNNKCNDVDTTFTFFSYMLDVFYSTSDTLQIKMKVTRLRLIVVMSDDTIFFRNSLIDCYNLLDRF